MSNNLAEIMRILKEADGKPVSGEELGERLGISRAMIWKYISSLKEGGYEIESSPKTGYVLKVVPDMLYPEEIKDGLNTTLIGTNIFYFAELESTNSFAREMAREAEEGTVVIAEAQKKGRGRLGRNWQSPKGGINLSVILKPNIPLDHAARLTLMTGLAAANTIRSLGLDARIKWPNDVLINDKKVCGILTEVDAEMEQIDYVIIGIGINANVNVEEFPPGIRENATSLQKELGIEVNRVEFVQRLLYELEQQYIKFKTQEFSAILSEWINLSDTIGKEVTIMTPSRMVEGKAVGITDTGAISVRTKDGKRVNLIAGRCVYTRTR